MPQPLTLSPAQLATYRRDGVLRVGQLLDPAELRSLVELLAGRHRPEFPNPYGVIVNDLWRQEPRVAELLLSSCMGRVAAALLGTAQAALFQDNLVWKTPDAARIEWHQDYSYMPVSEPAAVTLWLSLDAATPETGCLHYLPGTHTLGERAPADFIRGAGQPQRSDLPALDWEQRLDQVVPMPTRPGELLAHHPLVWHMSPQNRSAVQRRALSVNWLAPRVRWMPSQAPHPFNYALQPQDGEALSQQRFPRRPPLQG